MQVCWSRGRQFGDVMSLIAAQSHTFVEIDHDITSLAILHPLVDSRSCQFQVKVAQFVECPLSECEVMCSNLGSSIPKV